MINNLLRKIKDRLRLRRLSSSQYYGELDGYGGLLEDEYVDHLIYVVGGFLRRENLYAFDCCLKNMPAKGAIVEIGSFLGLSTNIITYGKIKYNRKNPFFTCDPWVFAGSDKPKAGYFSTGSKEYRRWVIKVFKMNMTLFSKGHKPHSIEATSDRFFKLWKAKAVVNDIFGRQVKLGGPISFAYIDGNHTYDAVKADFVNVNQYLLRDGFIFFDDSADDDDFEGVKQVVTEVNKDSLYELVLKAPNYCFRKKGEI